MPTSCLVPGDTNGEPDAFVHDRETGATTRVSISASGGEGNGFEIALSGNGRYVAFESSAALVAGDDNGTYDVYVHDLRSESTTQSATAGTTVTTDAEGDGANAFDPLESAVTTPSPGTVSIKATPTTTAPPTGFALLGQQVEITAPAATAENPLVVVFRLDASLIPPGEDDTTIQVLKDGVQLLACTGTLTTATPDPCISTRAALADGDFSLTVLTSGASLWTFAIRPPYTFTGFLSPVDNPPILNVVSAGRAIPVKFSLNGDQGLDIFAPGYPRSSPIGCDTSALLDAIEQTVTAGSSSLSYDARVDQYTYIWKTDKAWATTCRRLIVKLDDEREYHASFQFLK